MQKGPPGFPGGPRRLRLMALDDYPPGFLHSSMLLGFCPCNIEPLAAGSHTRPPNARRPEVLVTSWRFVVSDDCDRIVELPCRQRGTKSTIYFHCVIVFALHCDFLRFSGASSPRATAAGGTLPIPGERPRPFRRTSCSGVRGGSVRRLAGLPHLDGGCHPREAADARACVHASTCCSWPNGWGLARP
jgi:hypothetical protein